MDLQIPHRFNLLHTCEQGISQRRRKTPDLVMGHVRRKERNELDHTKQATRSVAGTTGDSASGRLNPDDLSRLEGEGGAAAPEPWLRRNRPAAPFDVELWVENDDDLPMAQELCQSWLHPEPGPSGTRVCAHCGQRLGSQFDSCWKCGTKPETTGKPNKEGPDDENRSRFVD
jgi:hypothetical protein